MLNRTQSTDSTSPRNEADSNTLIFAYNNYYVK
jgi:hypothetical protein